MFRPCICAALRPALGLALPLYLAACGSSTAPEGSVPAQSLLLYANPSVAAAPNIGKPFVAGTTFSFTPFNYQEQEYFYSGVAHSYVNDAALDQDGRWQVSVADSADYKTRMLVYRPVDPAMFNGTVIVEWLNVTGGVDTAAEWVTMHTELLRRGYAWVGISAQQIGVEGGSPPLGTPLPIAISLKLINPLRYASLSHPGDSFSYDIYAQAAQAIRHPQDLAPLGELQIARVIAAGQSQSAARLTTFVNAFGPRTTLFDGYFVDSRLGYVADFGGASAPLSQAPQSVINTPQVVRFRTDLGRPLLNQQTETDLLMLDAYHSRQSDHSQFRLWEIAGAAHADTYISKDGFSDTGDGSAATVYETRKNTPFSSCPEPINSAPQHHFIANAAIHALNTWLAEGKAPPSAPRLSVNAAGDTILRDAHGNALGGIRSPYLDAPTAVLSGENSSVMSDSSICFLYGLTQLLDTATLQSLYADHDAYVAAVTAAGQDAVNQGFLLSEDLQLIILAAQQSGVP